MPRSGSGNVINVTPRSTTTGVAHTIGLIVEVTGWVLVAVAAISALGAVALVFIALCLVWLGRKVRGTR